MSRIPLPLLPPPPLPPPRWSTRRRQADATLSLVPPSPPPARMRQTARRGGSRPAPPRGGARDLAESVPLGSPQVQNERKRKASAIETEAGPSSSPPVKKYRISAAALGRHYGPRPHVQEQCQLLDELPAEILDKIFGDDTLNARDHLALSGTCTAIRLGYSEELWKEMDPNAKCPFAHNAFTHDLLAKPGYLANSVSFRIPSRDDAPRLYLDRIWTTALARASDKSVKPGINFFAPCWRAKHKQCNCMRTNPTLGPNHSKVVSNVSLFKTSWNTITYHYRALADCMNGDDFPFEEKSNPKGIRTYMCCLATVDAAMLRTAGDPWNAWKILNTPRAKLQKKEKKKRHPAHEWG